MPISSGGKKNRSGRKTAREEKAFFAALDATLPKVVRFCSRLIDEAEKYKDDNLLNRKYHDEMALQAAKILISKAPERIQGTGENGEILIKNLVIDV